MTVGRWDTVGGAETAHRCCHIHKHGHANAACPCRCCCPENGGWKVWYPEPSTCGYRIITQQRSRDFGGMGVAADAPGGLHRRTETQASRLWMENSVTLWFWSYKRSRFGYIRHRCFLSSVCKSLFKSYCISYQHASMEPTAELKMRSSRCLGVSLKTVSGVSSVFPLL